jgi:hypothetical protein
VVRFGCWPLNHRKDREIIDAIRASACFSERSRNSLARSGGSQNFHHSTEVRQGCRGRHPKMLCSTATVLHRTDYGEHCGIWTTHPPPIPLEVVKLMREVLRTLLFITAQCAHALEFAEQQDHSSRGRFDRLGAYPCSDVRDWRRRNSAEVPPLRNRWASNIRRQHPGCAP